MKRVLRSVAFVLTLCCVLSIVISKNANAVSTSAKSFVVLNADTLEVLDANNAHLRLPMASTTKIMTALILAEQNTPDKEIITTAEMVTVEGSSMGLKVGDRVSFYELLVGMLLPSGNDAANTAAICVSGSIEKFTDLMNDRAKSIGMKNTNFVTPSGLDAEDHYSTAYDMALLTAEALKNDVIREIVSQDSITVSFGSPPYQRTLYNHNKLLRSYKYCVGVKTGFTKKSGRCLVSAAEKDGCRVVAVTLNDPDDWKDHEKLLEFGLSQLTLVDVTRDLPINSLDVVGGTMDNVAIAAQSCFCGGNSDTVFGITTEVHIKPFLYAPIQSGEIIGFVDYYYNGVYLKRTDIIALENVDSLVVDPTFLETFLSKLQLILRFFV